MNTAAAPKQTMRFSDSEIDLMRSNFLENDQLLKLIRKRLLQMEITEDEQSLLARLIPENSDLFRLVKKTVHPELDGDAPFFQMVDLYLNADVKDKPIEVAVLNILAREIMSKYLDEAFDKFYSFDSTFGNKFKALTDDVQGKLKDDGEQSLCASFLARNTLLNHVDFQLNQLLILANTKKISSEDLAEKAKKKSTK